MLSIEFIDKNKTSSIIEWNEDTRILTVEPKAKISFKVKQNEDSLDNLTGMNKASWALYNFNTLSPYLWSSDKKTSFKHLNSQYQTGFTFQIDKVDMEEEIVYWIEAILQTKNSKSSEKENVKIERPDHNSFLISSKKTNKLPLKVPNNILIVKVQKPKPEIVEARWYDPSFKNFNPSKDGWHTEDSLLSPDSERKIRSDSKVVKKYGEWVLLVIKTRGMIGENLKISLWDDDNAKKNYYQTSEYDLRDDIDNKNNEEGYYKGRKKGEAYEDEKLINFNYTLNKKVNKYGFIKVLIQIPTSWKQIIQDEFGDDFLNYEGKVAVKIDHPLLIKTQNNSKNIEYPTQITVGDPRAPIYYGKYLKIKNGVNKEPEPIPNIPPQITTIRDGRPMEIKKTDICKFNYIKISQGARDKIIFSETTDDYVISNLAPFEVVTAAVNRELVTIDLEDPKRLQSTKVNLCGIISGIKNTGEGEFHEGLIWKIVSTPFGDTFKTIDNTKETLKKENEAQKLAEKAKKEGKTVEESKWTFTNTQVIKVGNDKTNIEMSLTPASAFEIVKKTDQQLQFYAQYIYNQSDFSLFGLEVNPILRYLWPSVNAYSRYQISVQSCRYRRDIFIHTYPDIKWTIKLDYKGNRKSRELVSKFKKHQHAYRPTQGWITIGERELGLSLGATWDKNNKLDLQKDITEGIKKKLESFGAIGEFVKKVFLGEENKESKEYAKPKVNEGQLSSAQKADNKRKENIAAQEEVKKFRSHMRKDKQAYAEADTEKEKKKLEQKIANRQKKYDKRAGHSVDKKTGELKQNSLLRKPIGIDLISPSVSVDMAWSRVPITTEALPEDHHKTGMYLEGAIQVQPLIGIEAYLDFLALAQRAHPVAMAIITIADVSLKLIGDGSKMVVELRATGTIGGKLQGYVNTQTGENSFSNNKNEKEADGKELVKIKGDLSFSLKAQLVLKKKYTKFNAEISGEIEGKLEATAAWEASANIGANNKGWYFQPQIQFKGLELTGTLKIKGEATVNDDPLLSEKSSTAIRFQAIDPQPVTAWDKVYFMS